MSDKELSVLLKAMQAAGDSILSMQQTNMTVNRKSNNDIVTQADLRANDILKDHLLGAFPDCGWLSEESIDDTTRLHCKKIWVVDPIDGTREFASGMPEYAVSVALLENGRPVLGSVYNPATNELFYAIKNGGAWLGNQPLYCNHTPPDPNALILASRSEYQRGEWSPFESHCKVQPVGSIAYKLAQVAAGKACATFSLGPKSEWDIAAGVLLVMEAGGMATNRHRELIQFNQKNVLVDGIVATSAAMNGAIFSMIQSSSIPGESIPMTSQTAL